MKILFVCLGNICRSPLAEAIFKEKVRVRKLEHLFEADSCGTSNYNIGDEPDDRTIASAHKNHIPISHRARQLKKTDIEFFDLILAMDESNLRNILTMCEPTQISKVKLMRDFDPTGTGDVLDPYYGTEKDFNHVFEILDRSVEGLILNLIEKEL